ncbi:MAG TPA: SMI1/KNR4 family protein [Ktedonobacterales bacterium]|nr:SMI1/KNR4 family protein [Ktedonobacterales bacterium]
MPMAGLPPLDALLAADSFVRPSALQLPQWQELERELAITFPADYRELALRYDLATAEAAFTRFAPPATGSGEDGLLVGLRLSYNPDDSPFATFYRARQVIPVGVDYAERYFVLVVGQAQQRQRTPYPYGSLWLFDPVDPSAPNPTASVFQPVSSSFAQALHMAYYANSLYRGKTADSLAGDPHSSAWQTALFNRLTTLDTAIRKQSYWREWIAAMVS